MRTRPLIGCAILITTAVFVTTGCGSSGTRTDALSTSPTPTTATADAATFDATTGDEMTTETPSVDATAVDSTASDEGYQVGQGVEQTCQDLVGLFAIIKDADIAHGGHSDSDIQKAAAAASELAAKAPSEPSTSFLSGEPRESLQTIASAYQTYLEVLSEGDLEPGPDALLEPRVADAMTDVQIDFAAGLVPWIASRCSADVQQQLQQLAS